MQSPESSTQDRVDMATGGLGSFLVNLAYVLVVHGDQRVLLMLFATVVIGMGLLFTESKGAFGMGMLIGAGAAIATALALVAITGPVTETL